MRAAVPVALAFALAFALAPSALAAGYEVGERTAQATLDAARVATYHFPIAIREDGSLYAKILGTPGNAVFDGERSNGSWDVGFALVRADASREELGAFDNATATRLVPVHEGDALTFEATVDAPADAAAGGASQKVFVALAFRSLAATSASGSGASMDEARAFTLLVGVPASFAAGDGATSDPSASTPATPSPTAPAPSTPPVGEIPTTPTHAAGASTDTSASASASTSREQAAATPWLAIAALALGAVATAALVTIAVVSVLALRELRKTARAVPIARGEIRVHAEEAAPPHVASRPRKES